MRWCARLRADLSFIMCMRFMPIYFITNMSSSFETWCAGIINQQINWWWSGDNMAIVYPWPCLSHRGQYIEEYESNFGSLWRSCLEHGNTIECKRMARSSTSTRCAEIYGVSGDDNIAELFANKIYIIHIMQTILNYGSWDWWLRVVNKLKIVFRFHI